MLFNDDRKNNDIKKLFKEGFSMKKKVSILMTLVILLFTSINTYAVKLNDIENHWAENNIISLLDRGIISGYPNGTFKPENNVTRAEALKMILVLLKNDVGNATNGKWYDNYYNEALKNKYILEGEFDNLDKPITRGEFARLIIRALDEEYPENLKEYKNQITDYKNIPDEYKDFVLKAYTKGIITGYANGSFKAKNSVTRAEAVTMLIRFLDPNIRIIPDLKDEIVEEIEDDSFIEPDIYVHYFEGKYDYEHFAFILENAKEYKNKGAVSHTFVTECISHPNINSVYFKNVYGNFMDKKIDEIEQQKKTSPKFEGGNGIYGLAKKDNWKPVNGTFEGREGEKIQYKVTVSNGKTTKEYIIDVRFNDRKFY